MKALLWVALGGALGSMARYGVGLWGLRWMADKGSAFPIGTLAVNVLGGVVLGLVMELVVGDQGTPRALRLALGTGFCGAFTTFSTFSVESVRLMQEGHSGEALANVGLNLLLGLLGAVLGLGLGRALG